MRKGIVAGLGHLLVLVLSACAGVVDTVELESKESDLGVGAGSTHVDRQFGFRIDTTGFEDLRTPDAIPVVRAWVDDHQRGAVTLNLVTANLDNYADIQIAVAEASEKQVIRRESRLVGGLGGDLVHLQDAERYLTYVFVRVEEHLWEFKLESDDKQYVAADRLLERMLASFKFRAGDANSDDKATLVRNLDYQFQVDIEGAHGWVGPDQVFALTMALKEDGATVASLVVVYFGSSTTLTEQEEAAREGLGHLGYNIKKSASIKLGEDTWSEGEENAILFTLQGKVMGADRKAVQLTALADGHYLVLHASWEAKHTELVEPAVSRALDAFRLLE